MNATNIKERLSSLYKLREQLCDKQQKEMHLEEIKNWVVEQLSYLKTMSGDETVPRKEICMRIADIICALNIEEDDHE